MTHCYDRRQTFDYFEQFADLYDSYYDDANPHARDRLLLEKILPTLPAGSLTAVDFGCGGGHLVRMIGDRGHRVVGIEPTPGLYRLACEKMPAGVDSCRVELGGLDVLAKLESESLDLFVAMGVFQYVSDEEYVATFREIRRVVKPGGRVVASFQNALFDLFTFNKYTLDCFEHVMLRPLEPLGLDVEKAMRGISTLVTNPAVPAHDDKRARDNIFVRLTNPLTVAEELRQFELDQREIHFYGFQPVPPLIAKDIGDEFRRVADALEVTKSQEWYGHFMANAFVIDCVRR